MSADENDPALGFLQGGGRMAELIRSRDWRGTPLGPPAVWPDALKVALGTCLSSRFPMVVWWGPDLLMLYNDAWQPILGETKHPAGLGRPGAEFWPETWPIVGAQFEEALNGVASWSEDLLLASDRHGFLEECYFTYSHSPLRDATGTVVGVCSAVSETTDRVLGERRLRVLRALSAATVEAASRGASVEEAGRQLVDLLCAGNPDAPLAAVYLVDSEAGMARLIATTGAGHALFAEAVSLANGEDPWGVARALRGRSPAVSGDLAAAVGPLPGGVWPEPTRQGVAIPLASTDRVEDAFGALVVGINPRLRLDEPYLDFLGLVAAQLTSSVSTLRGIENELRHRHTLEGIFDAIEDGYQAVDRHGRFTYMNKAALRMLRAQGVDGAALIGQRIYHDAFAEGSGDAGHAGFRKCMAERVPVEGENFYEPWKRWYTVKWLPMPDGGVAIYFRDVTEAKTAEATQALLVREVDHRAKNVLAVATSIVSMTAAAGVEEFRREARDRLAALARAHDRLSGTRCQGTELAALVREELGAVSAPDAFEVAGPPVVLLEAAVQPVSLILHELATNACKHGAFSVAGGRLEVSWSFGAGGGLDIRWLERGGSPAAAAAPTSAAGLGTRLMEALARGMGAELRRDWCGGDGLALALHLPSKHVRLVEARAAQPGLAPLWGGGARPAVSLAGRRVLVVEDDALLALELGEKLAGLGARVLGPATRLDEGLQLARTGEADCAVLDLNLNGMSVLEIADVLAECGVPFLFCTGYVAPDLGAHRDRPLLRKPLRDQDLVDAIGALLEPSALRPTRPKQWDA